MQEEVDLEENHFKKQKSKKKQNQKTPPRPVFIKDLLHCLIVDIVPQKCHVRSHKSRAEITDSSYLSCHSFHLLLYTICKSLLTFMYKYIQFIDYSHSSDGDFFFLFVVVLLVGWLRNTSRGIHIADVTSPNVAHAYVGSLISAEHT